MTADTRQSEEIILRSQPPTPPSSPPALSPRELARWAWRQLTSMRTALVLLFLLAVAAVPGSVVPQRNIDAGKVDRFVKAHPTLAPLYDRLGLFNVYGSPWFSAVYLLLMVSLVGCVVPRLQVYWRALRARPPRVPRRLDRLPESRRFVVDTDPEATVELARRVLRRRRYRVAPHDGAVSAEKGYLREAGNLVFHLSVLIVLVGVGYGQLYGYKGGMIITVGDGFSNTLSSYDDFAPGRLFKPDRLSPLSFTVKDFRVSWVTSGAQLGQPRSFDADLTYRMSPTAPARRFKLAVNRPLDTPGADVFLVGHGYAPVVTVRGGDGRVSYRGPVTFLPLDSSFKSVGVIKVDASPEQLAFQGYFLPTYGFTMAAGPFSQYPDLVDPVLSLTPYHGNLGLDNGRPQSVYTLDTTRLKRFPSTTTANPNLLLKLRVGQTMKLPDGKGSIRFDSVKRWVKLQVSYTPGTGIALAGVVLALFGLMGSLFIRPRRVWVRVSRDPSDPRRTVVELAGLDRSAGGDLGDEVGTLQRLLGGGPDTSAAASPDAQDRAGAGTTGTTGSSTSNPRPGSDAT